MLGYATMAEVLIWVQTYGPAEVVVEYRPQNDPDQLFRTDPVVTEKATAFVAKCIADRVKAGTTYHYRVRVNGQVERPRFMADYSAEILPLTFTTPPNWRFREEGHAIFDFTVGAGSCNYVNDRPGGYDRLNGDPYGGDYEIFHAIYEQAPDLFLWLGDNTYLREPDWTSRTGLHYRWTVNRSLPEKRGMLATMFNYATWDDHDYGPNNAGWDFPNKGQATEAFQLFWGNPTAGLPELPGIFTSFSWGDVNFYLMDNRTYRTADAVAGGGRWPKQMFGRDQIEWLVQQMRWAHSQSELSRNPSYPLNFHVVAGGNQIFSPNSADSLPAYEEEFDYLFRRIREEGISGVVFLTGDVHFGEVSRRDFVGTEELGVPGHTQTFYDITTSPLTAGSWGGAAPERNPYRYDIFPGEMDRVGQRNFVTLEFRGPLREREMVIRYFDKDGNLLNQDPDGEGGEPTPESVIRANDLRLPRGR